MGAATRLKAGGAIRRVVLVTGAAGGLGRALVRQFLAAGWRVAAAYHLSTGHTESAQLWPVRLDVQDAGQVEDTVQQLLSRWGRIDALVNNAGLTADAPCWNLEDEPWEQVLAVNLKGSFLCCRAVLPAMRQARAGHIIHLASFSARSGERGQSNYAAAKAGLLGLTESLAREAGPWNIQVNAVLPGVLPTRLTARLPPEVLAGFASANTLGRINSIDEVARFIVFLAGMQNVSGQVFQLDSRVGRWA